MKRQAQLLTYLKLSGRTLGLLLNFNVYHLKKVGICCLVNGFVETTPLRPLAPSAVASDN